MEVTITHYIFSRHQQRTPRPGGGSGSVVNAKHHPGRLQVNKSEE